MLLFLTNLMACNSSNKESEQLTNDDTLQASRATIADSVSSKFTLDTIITSDFHGDTAAQIIKTLKLASDFDKAAVRFKKDTSIVLEKTSEGCEIIVVGDKSSDYLKFYGSLMGEMGQQHFSFYTLSGKHPQLLYAAYTNITYDKPIYIEDMKIRETKTTYEVYGGNRIVAVLNSQKKQLPLSVQELKTKESDTRQFFRDYIGQIEVVK